jgi:hypothetical protein
MSIFVFDPDGCRGVEKVTVISDRKGGRSMVNKKEECLPCCGSPFSEAC